MDYFNRVGVNASNVYYLNQDRKDQQIRDLKGSARSLAEELRAKQAMSMVERKTKMQEEAE